MQEVSPTRALLVAGPPLTGSRLLDGFQFLDLSPVRELPLAPILRSRIHQVLEAYQFVWSAYRQRVVCGRSPSNVELRHDDLRSYDDQSLPPNGN